MTSKRIFISTGEVSGDLQGALLVEALGRQAKQLGIELDIVALGGDRMAQAGAKLLANTSAIGSIGLLESLPYVGSTLKVQQIAKRYLAEQPPDLVVMIDYFGPNVVIGRFIRQAFPQVPTVYYIAPQEWVWSLGPANTQRILQISDRLLAIFPGEADYYRAKGGQVTWVGHPLVDRMQAAPSRAQARQALGIPPDQTAIALIPASRHQEIKYVLPVMFAAAQRLQERLQARLQEQSQPEISPVHFWIPLSLETYRQPIEQAMQDYGLSATIVADPSQTVIAAADLALAKSGTVNLEIALLNVPQVVMYRVNPVTAWIAKHILKFAIPFASPPNLVVMEAIVPEFIQDDATVDRIYHAAWELLTNPERRQTMLHQYDRMRSCLGEVGVCDRAAREILQDWHVIHH